MCCPRFSERGGWDARRARGGGPHPGCLASSPALAGRARSIWAGEVVLAPHWGFAPPGILPLIRGRRAVHCAISRWCMFLISRRAEALLRSGLVWFFLITSRAAAEGKKRRDGEG